MMRFELKALHLVAIKAFDEMEAVALGTASDTREFNERQFVFQFGAQLNRGAITQGAPLWTAFEYRYPPTNGVRPRTRCDIVVREHNGHNGGTMGWLEVKSTGLDEGGNWNNAFGNLGWREDFQKLGRVKGRAWQFQHKRAWVWLYQFENYRTKVDVAWGTSKEWSSPKPPSAYPTAFGSIYAGRVNLQRVISEIEAASQGALLSVRPRVRAKESLFSAMILTAMVGIGTSAMKS